MRTLKKKPRSRRGETLVEILVAILIIAVAAGLFATMYSASMSINLSAREQDENMFDAVGTLEEKIESGETGAPGSVTYEPTGDGAGSTQRVDVEVFTQDGMTSYHKKNESGGTP